MILSLPQEEVQYGIGFGAGEGYSGRTLIHYLKDIWAGNRSLVHTFWIFGLISGLVGTVISAILVMMYILAVLTPFVVGPLQIMWAVGVWRSSGNSDSLWKWPARIVTILFLISIPLMFFATFGEVTYTSS